MKEKREGKAKEQNAERESRNAEVGESKGLGWARAYSRQSVVSSPKNIRNDPLRFSAYSAPLRFLLR